jgi:hypothetical protein
MILNLQPGDQRRHANNGYARCNQSIPDGQAAAHGSFMNWRARERSMMPYEKNAQLASSWIFLLDWGHMSSMSPS